MYPTAPQSPLQPQAGQVPARALTTSIKRSVLAMSMRFSYDSRISEAVGIRRSVHPERISVCPTAIRHSVQELRPSRRIRHQA